MARKSKKETKQIPAGGSLDSLDIAPSEVEGEALIEKVKQARPKGVVEQFSITEELLALDETLPKTEQGRCSCLGITALTFPSMNNSMRSNMFTSHVNQFLNLEHAEHPYMFTTAENVAGKHSNSYYETKEDWVVYRKVAKYENLVDKPKVYKLFLYSPKRDLYDVITRTECTDLTENFGYNIDNEVIDSLEEGDKIKKGTVLFKSKSFDEYMNYGYGINVTAIYTTEPYTSEDAAIVSESLAKYMTSIESEHIDLKLNDNDFLLNIYGDKKHYKPIPDVGEHVHSNVIAASRRLFNNQVLTDFRGKKLREAMPSDTRYFVDGKDEVLDATIYSNNEEIRDNGFNDQVNGYLREQNAYYKELYNICKEIEDSGSNYTRDVDYLKKRSKEMIDTKKKWMESDSAFSNMMIRLNVRKTCEITNGQKITFRAGNKSVVAVIRPDSQMPYTKDGRKVHVMVNLLAIINRTTASPIAEQLITSICWKCRQKMATLPTLDLKADLGFELIRDFNEDEYKKMHKIYTKLKTEKEREEFVESMIVEGIYIHEKPMYSETFLFDRLLNIMKKYDWLLKDDLYINKWGRRIKCLRKEFVGQMYILKLKQTDRRGYSSRNTGAIDITGLPARRYRSRSHLEQTSSTAIRFGEFETLNFSIGLLPEQIAIFHALYRTSIKGRRDFLKATLTNTPLSEALDDTYVSRVAEIFKVKMKALGVGVAFVDEDDILVPLDDNVISPHHFKGKEILCTNYQFFVLKVEDTIREEILNERLIMTKDELEKEIKRRIKKRIGVVGIEYKEDGTLMLEKIVKD